MDELKELYGIEMTQYDKKVVALSILSNEFYMAGKVLELASNSPQRIDALKKQEALKYMASLLGETE